jgi:hypothetical protein
VTAVFVVFNVPELDGPLVMGNTGPPARAFAFCACVHPRVYEKEKKEREGEMKRKV